MAEPNGKESPEQETSNITSFPEIEGKIVKSIQLTSESGYYGIDINFTDNTAMVFAIEPFVVAHPIYGDWKTGERKIIKEFKPIRSVSLKTP